MTSIKRWIKREYHRCFYMKTYFLRSFLVLFVILIIFLQIHTMATTRHYGNGVDIEGNRYRAKHQRPRHENDVEDDEDDFVAHYVVQVGEHRKMRTHQMELDALVIVNGTQRDKLDPKLRNTRYLRLKHKGRLGNAMFAYASLLGIAKANKMIAVLPEDNILRKYFLLSAKPERPEQKFKVWPQFIDNRGARFDPRLFNLNFTMDIELRGFFQSWRYFLNIREQILREFTFHSDIQIEAQELLQNLIYQTVDSLTSVEDLTLVGIHIRRGDLLEPHNVEKGYTVAPREYLLKGIRYFEEKFNPETLVFVVTSDDMVWVRANLRQQKALMVFSVLHEDVQDLALMSHCHHVITTVGTFSWWAGFLSKGSVLYFKDFPRPHSTLARNFKAADYFPKHWIGFGREDLIT